MTGTIPATRVQAHEKRPQRQDIDHSYLRGVSQVAGGFIKGAPASPKAVPIPATLTLAAVLDAFNAGHDTADIAKSYGVHESVVYNMLAWERK